MTDSVSSLLIRLADNKYLLGRRFSEWTNRAPALEAAVAAAAMTQDELGHARSLYATLQSTPDAPEAYLDDSHGAQQLGAPILATPFLNWPDFVAAAALFDRAMTLVFEVVHHASYEPLYQRAGKILQEEWYHRQYGEGWLKRLASEPKTHAAMQAAVNRFWQPTADWLTTVEEDFATEGILTESALRQTWINETEALLSKCNLTRP